MLVYAGERGELSISGAERAIASDRAESRAAAVGKRSCWSVARLRMMTAEKAGEIPGFSWLGGGGVLLCSSVFRAARSPWKGGVPVESS